MAEQQDRIGSIKMEEEESVYFDEVTKFNDMCSLDQSGDSLRGSVTFPTFNMAQSVALQGSHGFQAGFHGDTFMVNQSTDGRSGTQLQLKSMEPGASVDKVVNEGTEVEYGAKMGSTIQMCSGNMVTPIYQIGRDAHRALNEKHTFTALKPQTDLPVFNPTGNQFQNFHFVSTNNGTFIAQLGNETDCEITNPTEPRLSTINVQGTSTDVRSSGENYKILPSISQESLHKMNTTSTPNVRSERKMDTEVCTESSEMTEQAGSSDEKSQKAKMSPKRRGKKPRKTSSTGNEPQVSIQDGQQHITSPSRLESCQSEPPVSACDGGFRPPLLDEILAEKKLALMRSPEVMRFLQSQQENFVREKKTSHGQHIDKS